MTRPDPTRPLDAWPGLRIGPLVRRLRRYNAWRRGAEIAQPDPATIGADLDAAVTRLEDLAQAIRVTLETHPHLADGDHCTLIALTRVAREESNPQDPRP